MIIGSAIYQKHSWSPLQVSEEMFESLKSHVGAFDELRNTVMSFRNKTTDLEEALTVLSWKDEVSTHGEVFECFLRIEH